MENSTSLWYYAGAGNKAVGPVPFHELDALFQKGVIKNATYVMREGDQQWRLFGQVREEHFGHAYQAQAECHQGSQTAKHAQASERQPVWVYVLVGFAVILILSRLISSVAESGSSVNSVTAAIPSPAPEKTLSREDPEAYYPADNVSIAGGSPVWSDPQLLMQALSAEQAGNVSSAHQLRVELEKMKTTMEKITPATVVAAGDLNGQFYRLERALPDGTYQTLYVMWYDLRPLDPQEHSVAQTNRSSTERQTIFPTKANGDYDSAEGLSQPTPPYITLSNKNMPLEVELALVNANAGSLPSNDITIRRFRYLLQRAAELTGDSQRDIADYVSKGQGLVNQNGKQISLLEFMERANRLLETSGVSGIKYQDAATMTAVELSQ